VTTMEATATAQLQPVDQRHGLPVYASQAAPDTLVTKSQLTARRLKVAEGQKPAAYVRIQKPHPGAGDVPLYRPEDAARMRPLSARQQQQYTARRTCVLCTTVYETPLCHRTHPWLPQPGPVCDDCNRCHEDRWRRTCERCRTQFRHPENISYAGRLCAPCDSIRRHGQELAHRLARRHCPDCTVQTVSREELAAADAAEPYGLAYGYPRTCEPCRAERKRQAEAARRAEERERWHELGPVRQWARHVVAHPELYALLDTETTGLDDDAVVVDIAVTDGAGNPLINTLVNPGVPIPEDSSEIHGIHDEDVREAPTFGAILPDLTEALRGRRVIIYNRSYDMGVLAYELDRHHHAHTPTLDGTSPPDGPHPAADAWMDAQEWDRCAMLAYAVHVGEWSAYWQNWQWPPLDGEHRALSDCHKVAARIRIMAERSDPFDVLPGPDDAGTE
jgi:exonuclease